MRKRRSGSNAALAPKICGSGWKRMRVPRRLCTSPAGFSFEVGLPRAKRLAIELSVARDLDLEMVGERVHHRHADAVQAAGGLVDLGIEFSAGVQRRHDDFERRLVLELRVRVDRDAAAVVGDGEEAVLVELDLDPVGVAGDGLVHGIVHHLGEEVMHRLLVGAADIHAGAAADGLEPLQAPRCRRRCSSDCRSSARPRALRAREVADAGEPASFEKRSSARSMRAIFGHELVNILPTRREAGQEPGICGGFARAAEARERRAARMEIGGNSVFRKQLRREPRKT